MATSVTLLPYLQAVHANAAVTIAFHTPVAAGAPQLKLPPLSSCHSCLPSLVSTTTLLLHKLFPNALLPQPPLPCSCCDSNQTTVGCWMTVATGTCGGAMCLSNSQHMPPVCKLYLHIGTKHSSQCYCNHAAIMLPHTAVIRFQQAEAAPMTRLFHKEAAGGLSLDFRHMRHSTTTTGTACLLESCNALTSWKCWITSNHLTLRLETNCMCTLICLQS